MTNVFEEKLEEVKERTIENHLDILKKDLRDKAKKSEEELKENGLGGVIPPDEKIFISEASGESGKCSLYGVINYEGGNEIHFDWKATKPFIEAYGERRLINEFSDLDVGIEKVNKISETSYSLKVRFSSDRAYEKIKEIENKVPTEKENYNGGLLERL